MKTKFSDFINESIDYDNLRTIVDRLFSRLGGTLPEEEVTKKGLLESMKMIGDGDIEINDDQDRVTYTENLSDNRLLKVWGHIGYPVMTRCYSYEIRIVKDSPYTTQYGGGYGSPGIIAKDKPRLFNYDTYQTVYSNKTIISKVCEEIKKLVE